MIYIVYFIISIFLLYVIVYAAVMRGIGHIEERIEEKSFNQRQRQKPALKESIDYMLVKGLLTHEEYGAITQSLQSRSANQSDEQEHMIQTFGELRDRGIISEAFYQEKLQRLRRYYED